MLLLPISPLFFPLSFKVQYFLEYLLIGLLQVNILRYTACFLNLQLRFLYTYLSPSPSLGRWSQRQMQTDLAWTDLVCIHVNTQIYNWLVSLQSWSHKERDNFRLKGLNSHLKIQYGHWENVYFFLLKEYITFIPFPCLLLMRL